MVVRDEEWLVTSAEQGSDGWLVKVRGLNELLGQPSERWRCTVTDNAIGLLDGAPVAFGEGTDKCWSHVDGPLAVTSTVLHESETSKRSSWSPTETKDLRFTTAVCGRNGYDYRIGWG